MASHYVSVSRPIKAGPDALTTGTSSTAGAEIELRVLDGAGLTMKNVQEALEAFENFLLDRRVSSAFDANP